MKNQTTKSLGIYKETYYYKPNGPTNSTSKSMESGRKEVQGGPMIDGNGKNPNPWSYSVYGSTYLNGSCIDEAPSFTQVREGVLSNSVPGLADLSGAEQRAYDRANRTANRKLFDRLRGSTDLSVSAFEAANGQLKKTGTQLMKVVDKTTRTLHLDTPKGVAKSLGTSILWMNFGAMPVLQDIYAITEQLTSTCERKGFIVEASGYSQETPNGRTALWANNNYPCTISGQCTCQVRYCVRMRVNPSLDRMARLTSLDPLSIAWELTPYSWLADYVYNVGDYLRDLETSAMYKSALVSGYKSVRQRANVSMNISGKASGVPSRVLNASGSVVKQNFSRTMVNSLPVSRPKLELPKTSGQLTNVGALISAKLKLPTRKVLNFR